MVLSLGDQQAVLLQVLPDDKPAPSVAAAADSQPAQIRVYPDW